MLKQEQKDILNHYAEIKANIKHLETQAELLNPKVLEIMALNEVEEISLEDKGKLTLGSRRKWEYTPETKALEKDLKSAKKEEEQTGLASYSELKYVIFKGLKEDENE